MTRNAKSTAKVAMMLAATCFAGCGELGADGGVTAADEALRGHHHPAGSVTGPVSFGTIDPSGINAGA